MHLLLQGAPMTWGHQHAIPLVMMEMACRLFTARCKFRNAGGTHMQKPATLFPCCCSVAQSCPRVCSNSCPLSQWCQPTISSSLFLFSSCLQSFPASGSFPVSRLFTSGGQSIGASASASVLPMNSQGWFPLGLTCLISIEYFYSLMVFFVKSFFMGGNLLCH